MSSTCKLPRKGGCNNLANRFEDVMFSRTFYDVLFAGSFCPLFAAPNLLSWIWMKIGTAKIRHQFIVTLLFYMEQGEFCQYSGSLGNGRSGIRIPTREMIFHSSVPFSPALGSTQPPTQWVSAYFPGAKRPSVLRLRMSGIIPLLPLYVFMAWTGTTSPCCCYSLTISLI